MRAPPAVSIESNPGLIWRACQTLLHASAGAAIAAWVAAWVDVAPSAPVLIGPTALAAALGWRLSGAPATRLSWTGARWTVCRGEGEPAVVLPPQVMIDLGAWVLLRLKPENGGAPQWLALGRDGQAGSWHLFRAAVYFAAPDPGARSAEERLPF